MRDFFMVRHGESTANLSNVASGQLDVGLTPTGERQAAACRRTLQANGIAPDVILCSSLGRTWQTADIINRDLQRPVHRYLELNEQHYGDWQGESWDVIRPKVEQVGHNPPNGERWDDFSARARTAVLSLLDEHDGTVLFVTHGGVLGALLSKYGHRLPRLANGVLHRLTISNDKQRLIDVVSFRGRRSDREPVPTGQAQRSAGP